MAFEKIKKLFFINYFSNNIDFFSREISEEHENASRLKQDL